MQQYESILWRDIKDYEGLYQISSQGDIRNSNGLIMKQRLDKDGYKRITLTKRENGKKILKTFQIHQLVAINFLDNPNYYDCVNHKDENKMNNYVENLEWCTRAYNNSYTKRFPKGGINKPVINLNTGKIYKSMTEAGREMGVTCGAIYNCCIGRNKTSAGYVWGFQ